MIQLDITKLRPGDLLFTAESSKSSLWIRVLTLGKYSHVLIVLYPDIWFETDGRGAGYREISSSQIGSTHSGRAAIVHELEATNLKVLRLKSVKLSPRDILRSVADHICLEYPTVCEFLPLIFGLRGVPSLTERLVDLCLSFWGKQKNVYCSQLVYRTIKSIYPQALVHTRSEHISPQKFLKVMKFHCSDVTNSVVANSAIVTRSAPLEKKFSNLKSVTNRLKKYQYPHDIQQWNQSIQSLFDSYEIPLDPNDFRANTAQIQMALSNPKNFLIHDLFWPTRYS